METTKNAPEESQQALPFAGRLGANQRFTISDKDQPEARPFAGRIGGNQAFTVSQSNPDAEEIVKETPDAAPLRNLKDAIDLRGFFQPVIWKAAIVECWGMSRPCRTWEINLLNWDCKVCRCLFFPPD